MSAAWQRGSRIFRSCWSRIYKRHCHLFMDTTRQVIDQLYFNMPCAHTGRKMSGKVFVNSLVGSHKIRALCIQDIKKAYFKLCKMHHPDKFKNDPVATDSQHCTMNAPIVAHKTRRDARRKHLVGHKTMWGRFGGIYWLGRGRGHAINSLLAPKLFHPLQERTCSHSHHFAF